MVQKNRRKHDALHAVQVFSSLIEFLESGFDFSSPDGKEILEEARRAALLLEKEITEVFERQNINV